jgi:hypothetical protein
MKERPSWIRVIEGGKSDAPEKEAHDDLPHALAVAEALTPSDWRSHVEEELLDLYRRHMMLWNDEQLTYHLMQEGVWEDATFARALIEVTKGRVVPVFQDTSA